MAQQRAPGPDPDGSDPDGLDPDGPTRRSLGPFVAAVAVVAVLAVVVLAAQIFAPSGATLDDSEQINRTVGDYVRAHNDNDTGVLAHLRCAALPADEAPLAGVGAVEFGGSGNVVVDGDRGTVDVITTVDDGPRTQTWQVTRVDDAWRICTF